jgi:hypothetical protein
LIVNRKDKIQDLFELCALSKKCFQNSNILDANEVLAWIALVEYSESILNQTKKGEKLNSYQKKSIETELLKYWNNHLNIEVENFWKLVEESQMDFKRQDTYGNIIAKKRFKNVEQAIDTYNEIYSRPLPKSNNHQLQDKLDSLYDIVKIDREKRINQVRKWIRNERVSMSDSMKFGENYAYLKRTGLFDDIFGQKEKDTIEKLAKR